MLNNLKNLYQLQSKAKEIQQRLKDEIIKVEKNGIKLKINGKQEVLSIELNSELSQQEQEKNLFFCMDPLEQGKQLYHMLQQEKPMQKYLN